MGMPMLLWAVASRLCSITTHRGVAIGSLPAENSYGVTLTGCVQSSFETRLYGALAMLCLASEKKYAYGLMDTPFRIASGTDLGSTL